MGDPCSHVGKGGHVRLMATGPWRHSSELGAGCEDRLRKWFCSSSWQSPVSRLIDRGNHFLRTFVNCQYRLEGQEANRLVSSYSRPWAHLAENTPSAQMQEPTFRSPTRLRTNALRQSRQFSKILRPRSCDVGSIHIALYVDDMDAALSRASEAGWVAVAEPQTVEGGERDGMRLIYLRGPDGVTVESMQNARIASGTTSP